MRRGVRGKLGQMERKFLNSRMDLGVGARMRRNKKGTRTAGDPTRDVVVGSEINGGDIEVSGERRPEKGACWCRAISVVGQTIEELMATTAVEGVWRLFEKVQEECFTESKARAGEQQEERGEGEERMELTGERREERERSSKNGGKGGEKSDWRKRERRKSDWWKKERRKSDWWEKERGQSDWRKQERRKLGWRKKEKNGEQNSARRSGKKSDSVMGGNWLRPWRRKWEEVDNPIMKREEETRGEWKIRGHTFNC